MSTQLAHWKGQFGHDYLNRNKVDWRTRKDTLHRIIPHGANDILEIGCSGGHNLIAIREARDWTLVRGVEPADEARELARSRGLVVLAGDIYRIPYENRGFDLTFTSGVLIHVPADRLDDALREMVRVADRWLLAIEYFADQDTEVEYRGLPDMLWRRDYGAHYQRLFPELRMLDSGDMRDGDGFAGARYWLLEKGRP